MKTVKSGTAIIAEPKRTAQIGEPMRVIIRFKSGFELPITCDKFSISKNAYTGEITEYEIKGIKDNKLIFFRSEDVECIYREMTNDETD